MNRYTATIEIHLQSEAILGGDGKTKGAVDIDIQSDEFGLPYFSARTLKGVLRKQASWYVACLPENVRPDYEEALFQLFGKSDKEDEHYDYTNNEALRFGNAKLSSSLYKVIEEEKCSPREAMKAITSIRTMTSIDDETGTAKDRSLRKARTIHSGYTFIAPIYVNRALSEKEKELLELSVKLLRHIGLMRHRGKGEVKCALHWEDGKGNKKSDNKKNKTGKFIQLTIDAEEPLKINDVQRTSDSTIALTYIPGSALRGALIHKYLKDRKMNPDELATEHVFHPEKIQFWNGYKVINGKRSLPFAQHLFETKADSKSDKPKKDIYNSLQDGGLREIENQSPVRISRDMMVFGQNEIIGDNVNITSSLHINLYGPKKKQDETLMYRYEAIAPKQQFQAVVKANEDNDFVQWLKEQDDFYVWLGGARNSGYGRCRIQVETMDEYSEFPDKMPPFTDEMYIIATSDWIIYNQNGQLVSALDEEWLGNQLGIKLKLVDQVVNTKITGGYISNWSAYQPMIRSVKAGSIYRYKILNGKVNEEKLQTLIDRGIGARTNEGFGRFIILPKWGYSIIKKPGSSTKKQMEERRLHNKEKEEAETNLLRKAIIDERTRKEMLEQVQTWFDHSEKLDEIKNAQWSKILQVTTDLLCTKGNLVQIYEKKWKKFWEDVKNRSENKLKANFENVKIAVAKDKKVSLETFITEDLYHKNWKNIHDRETSLYWSLEALELLIRKVLRDKRGKAD